MLELNVTTQFRRDRRLCIKRGYDMKLLRAVVDTLRIPAPLPPENRDHVLSSRYGAGIRSVSTTAGGGNATFSPIGC